MTSVNLWNSFMKKEPYTFPKIYVDEALAKQLTFAQNEYPDLLEEMQVVNDFWQMGVLEQFAMFLDSHSPTNLGAEQYRLAKKTFKAMLYMKKAELFLQKNGYEGISQYINMAENPGRRIQFKEVYRQSVDDPYCGWDLSMLKDLVNILEKYPPGEGQKKMIESFSERARQKRKLDEKNAGKNLITFDNLSLIDTLLEVGCDYLGKTVEELEREGIEKEKEEARNQEFKEFFLHGGPIDWDTWDDWDNEDEESNDEDDYDEDEDDGDNDE